MKQLIYAFVFLVTTQSLAFGKQLVFQKDSRVPLALQQVIQAEFNRSCQWDIESTTPVELGVVLQEVAIDQGQTERHYLVGFRYESASGNTSSFSITAVEYPTLNVTSESERFSVSELPGFCF